MKVFVLALVAVVPLMAPWDDESLPPSPPPCHVGIDLQVRAALPWGRGRMDRVQVGSRSHLGAVRRHVLLGHRGASLRRTPRAAPRRSRRRCVGAGGASSGGANAGRLDLVHGGVAGARDSFVGARGAHGRRSRAHRIEADRDVAPGNSRTTGAASTRPRARARSRTFSVAVAAAHARRTDVSDAAAGSDDLRR